MEENLNKNEIEGVICTLEDREVLEKMKQAKIKKLKEIEANKRTENIINAGCDIAKGVVSVAGAVLTVVMAVCPFDGPAGEVAAVLGSTALVKAIDSSKELLKASLVSKDSSEISGALLDLSGNIKEIKVKDKDIVENVKNEELKDTDYYNKNVNTNINENNVYEDNKRNYGI